MTADRITNKDYANAATTGLATDYGDANVINTTKEAADTNREDAAVANPDAADYHRLFEQAKPGANAGRLAADNPQRPSNNGAKVAEMNA